MNPMIPEWIFNLPAGSGRLESSELFPGKVVKVDESFFTSLGSGEYRLDQVRQFRVYVQIPTNILDKFPVLRIPEDRDAICAALAHLSQGTILGVPEGEEEVNFILGVAGDLVLFVEHEVEGGKEEFHLHARPMSRLGKKLYMVLT